MGKIIKMYENGFKKIPYDDYKKRGYMGRIINIINKNLLVKRLTRIINGSNSN